MRVETFVYAELDEVRIMILITNIVVILIKGCLHLQYQLKL